MGGGLMCGSKRKANETTDNIRQNENLHLKNEQNIWYYSPIHSLKKIYT